MASDLDRAGDAMTDASALVRLSTSPSREVRAAVAANPSTPLDLLWALGERFPEALALNPLLPLLMLEQPEAFSKISSQLALALLRCPSTPSWLSAHLCRAGPLRTEELLALSVGEDTPAFVLEALASARSVVVRGALALSPRLPEAAAAALALDRSAEVRALLASGPAAPVACRKQLAQDPSPTVRFAARSRLEPAPVVERGLLLATSHAALGAREHQEDVALVAPLPGGVLAAVFDGMGGHSSGDVAARAGAAELSRALGQLLPHAGPDERQLALSLAILSSRQAVALLSARLECRGTCSTVAAVVLDDERAVIAHVGDSRVYRLRGGRLEALTEDHSLLNECIRNRVSLSEKQWAELPRNVITRALGAMEPELLVDTLVEPLEAGDVFLACTDGVHGGLPHEELERILMEASAAGLDAARAVVEAAVAAGCQDNATAVVVLGRSSGRPQR